MVSVSVVLPTYNERENIAEAIQRISRSLGKSLREIIVVDDNSPDGTWRIARGKPKVRVIRRVEERGLASALGRGISEARGGIVVWLDCDLGIPPEEIPRLVDALDRADIAIGSRYAPGGADRRHWLRALASTALNLFASMVLGWGVRDYTSGFAAVRREVFRAVPFPSGGFFGDYFIDFMYKAKSRFRIVEMGYAYTDRKGGTSKYKGDLFTLLRYGVRYGVKILRLRLGG